MRTGGASSTAPQGGGIAGLVAAEEPAAHGLEGGELALGGGARGDANRPLPPAPLGELGQGLEGGLGRAEAGEELIKGDGPRYPVAVSGN